MLVFADEVVMEKEIIQFNGYDGFEYLAGCTCQDYWPIVGWQRWITFFEFRGDNRVLPLGGEILEIYEGTIVDKGKEIEIDEF